MGPKLSPRQLDRAMHLNRLRSFGKSFNTPRRSPEQLPESDMRPREQIRTQVITSTIGANSFE